MVGYRNTSDIAKKAAEVAQKMSSRAHGEFYIYNGSETTTWMGLASTPKTQNLKQHFQDNNIFFEFQPADH